MQPLQPWTKIITNTMRKTDKKGIAIKKSINKVSERRAAYIFTVPAVALLAAFLISPSLQTIRYAFTDYNIMRPDRIVFCGFNNFAELFQDKDFGTAVKNTLYFTVLVVPFQTVLALALALFISSRRKGVSVFRAACKIGVETMRIPKRPKSGNEFYYIYVSMAGSRLPDDDFPRRPAGHFTGTV